MPVVVVVAGVALDIIDCIVILATAYFATQLLVRPLAWLLGQIPVIGRQIADALVSGAAAFQTWAQDQAKNAVGALVALVSAPVKWLGDVINAVAAYAEAMVAQVVAVIGRVGQLAAQVALGLASIAVELAAQAARITAVAASIAGIATRVAESAVTVLEARVVLWIDGVRLAIGQAIDTARVELGHAIDGVNARITAEVLGLTHAIDVAVTGLRGWVTDTLRPIESELSGVKGVTDAVVTAGVVPFAVAWATELPRLVDECVKPGCAALGPSLDVLNALADGALLAELAVLVSVAVEHPQEGADAVSAVVGPIVAPARSFLDLAGIAV